MARTSSSKSSKKKASNLVEFQGKRIKKTPMIEQYLRAKSQQPNAVLFFRMGDFYELFFDDAKLAHRELGITLTARNKGDDAGDEIPMAGVPCRAADEYVVTLVENGHRVAICDQLESPSASSGIVHRGITRIVTPGTMMDERVGEAREARLLAAVGVRTRRGRIEDEIGLAFIDVSTGRFSATEVVGTASLAAELQRLDVCELLVDETHLGLIEPITQRLMRKVLVQPVFEDAFDPGAVMRSVAEGPRDIGDLEDAAVFADEEGVKAFFDAVEEYGFRSPRAVKAAVAAVIDYVTETQRGIAGHVQALDPYRVDAFMVIDDATQANLEIAETMRGGRREGSLVGVLDETVTAAGSRRLRTWLSYPLLDAERIEARHDAVGALVDGYSIRERLRELLDRTHDIERLTARLATGRATPRHLVQLRQTLSVVPDLRAELAKLDAPVLGEMRDGLDPCEDVRDLIARAIVDEPPTTIQEGGVIRDGFDDELDRIVEVARSGKQWLLEYEAQQKKETDIGSLKVRFNKVFGYFIEITRANLHLVPDHYTRRQTLTNSERFVTDELKAYEEEVLTAEERRQTLEQRLFDEVRARVTSQLGRLRHTASHLAETDVVSALATVAHERDYCRPEMRDDEVLLVESGRHPVVERFLEGERFVPNDLEMSGDEARLQIITGPNMAGKSTVIRQAALIVLLAQAGSFVPAKRAEIGLVDRIFSRVGASDNLALGQSTFMVEMTETANILAHATERSLVILDEIGRGTSTYDGLSIAWSVAEHLHDEIGARVLFATHYHELTELSRTLEGVVNYSVAVKEWQQQIIFLRKLVEGAANRSYGIQVARLAGLPDIVIERAEEILYNLEMNSYDQHGRPTFAHHLADENVDDGEGRADADEGEAHEAPQFSLFGRAPADVHAAAQRAERRERRRQKVHDGVLSEIRDVSLDTTTPLEALNLLYAWQRKLKNR